MMSVTGTSSTQFLGCGHINTSSIQDSGLVYQPTDDVAEIQQGLPVKKEYRLQRIVFHPYLVGADLQVAIQKWSSSYWYCHLQ